MQFRTFLCFIALIMSCGDDTTTQPDDPIRTDRDMGVASPNDASRDGLPADVGCTSDAMCDDGIFCNGVERCFEGECFASPRPACDAPHECTVEGCDEIGRRCDFIPDDSLCAPGQVCDLKAGCFTPASCVTDAECDDGLMCNGAEVCQQGQCAPGVVMDCADGVACTADSCVEGSGCQSVPDHSQCLVGELCGLTAGCQVRPPCVRDDDCDDGLFCNGTEFCSDGSCAAGQPLVIPDNQNCTIDQCDESLDLVIHVPDHARCSDGQFCNGPEQCSPASGCGPGTPPVLSDGVACTDDRCDEMFDIVEHVPMDAMCDNSLFCDGQEICHPVNGCSPGEPPLLNDGVGCTIDTCSEVMAAVLHVPDDGLCDDGLFCNGDEMCDAVNGCLSIPRNVDDGVPCTDDGCDEIADVITHTPNHGLCQNNVICDGAEICDAVAGCLDGPPVDPDDGVACTNDSCDEVNGVLNVPDDAFCQNGLYCDGVESCDVNNGCQDEADPNVNDNNPCTIDFCDEVADTDGHTNEPDGTVCLAAPRSICLGAVCGQSVCGDGYTDIGAGEECDDMNNDPNDGCDNCLNVAGNCTWFEYHSYPGSGPVGSNQFLAVEEVATRFDQNDLTFPLTITQVQIYTPNDGHTYQFDLRYDGAGQPGAMIPNSGMTFAATGGFDVHTLPTPITLNSPTSFWGVLSATTGFWTASGDGNGEVTANYVSSCLSLDGITCFTPPSWNTLNSLGGQFAAIDDLLISIGIDCP